MESQSKVIKYNSIKTPPRSSNTSIELQDLKPGYDPPGNEMDNKALLGGSHHQQGKKPVDYSSTISALSNLSIQYNLTVIAICLQLMDSGDPDPAFPRSESQDSMLKSSVFAGAIAGQASMGYLGDLIGKGNAMIVTCTFTFLGAMMSAFATWGGADSIYTVLILARFVMGVGIGGKYPLAGTLRGESVVEGEHRATEVAKGFFWQTPGTIIPYIIAYILVYIFGEDKTGAAYSDVASFQFRILFGIGGVPSFAVIILCYLHIKGRKHLHNSQETTMVSRESLDRANNNWRVEVRNPIHLKALIGTAGAWWLYDIVYYGTTNNQPSIVDKVFGSDEDLLENCFHNIILNSMGLPAVVMAIVNLKGMGEKALQSWGFMAISFSSLLLAATLQYFPDSNNVNFICCCFLIFTLNWGVNVSTYVMPIGAYPPEVSGTFFGLSAAGGKLGAFVGAYVFDPLTEWTSLPWVYTFCTIVGVVAVAVTSHFVRPYGRETFYRHKNSTDEEEEEEEEVQEYA